MNTSQALVSPYLDTKAAAAFLGLSASYLEVLRVKGSGPTYYKVGKRCLYRVNELEDWVQSNRRSHTAA